MIAPIPGLLAADPLLSILIASLQRRRYTRSKPALIYLQENMPPLRTTLVPCLLFFLVCHAALAQQRIVPCKDESDTGPCRVAHKSLFKNLQPKPGLSAELMDNYLVVSWVGPAKRVTFNGIEFDKPFPLVAPDVRQIVIQYADAQKIKSAIPLNVTHIDDTKTFESVDVIGPQAHPVVIAAPAPVEHMDFPGTGLQAHIWLPSGYTPGRRYPIVYVADSGENRGELAAELIRTGKLAPLIVVGVDVCSKTQPSPNCRERYIDMEMPELGVTKQGFNEYQAFFVHTVIPQVEARYGAPQDVSQRAIAGESNGGAWAASVALHNPDLIGRVIAMSPGGAALYQPLERPTKAVYAMSGGVLESGFSNQARCFAGRVVEAGGSATLRIYPSGHSRLMWEEEFVQAMLDWQGVNRPPLTLAPSRPGWCPENWGA